MTFVKLYFGRTYSSQHVGSRIAGVCCNKCGCQYYYELRRAATGQSTAHYGLGTEAASDKAVESARDEVAERLKSDSEPVPCPQCHWINEDLEQAYRRKIARGCGPLTVIVAFIGATTSLYCGWVISNGPGADRAMATALLLTIPSLIALIATSLIVALLLLRSRINLNRNYPWPPSLPSGLPPALVADPETGDLMVAPPNELPGDTQFRSTTPTKQFEYFIGRNQMPESCCVCLAKSEPECTETHELDQVRIGLPLCPRCRRTQTLRRFATTMASTVILTAGLAVVAIWLNWLPQREISYYVPLVMVPLFVVCGLMSTNFFRAARIIGYRRERGVATIQFQHSGFAGLILDQSRLSEVAPDVTTIALELLPFEQVDVNLSGETLVGVRCEKCRCDFFYELKRTVRVRATNLSSSAQATKTASGEANSELQEQLQTETEPVPCPKCCWINENMARDYRNRSYQGCGILTFAAALFVCSISLVIGWFLMLGPPADRGPVPLLMIYFPSTMGGLSLIVILSCMILRSRVNPNANYPNPPDLPSDVPTALLRDEETGTFVRVARSITSRSTP